MVSSVSLYFIFYFYAVQPAERLPTDTWREITDFLADESLCKLSQSNREFCDLTEEARKQRQTIVYNIDQIRRFMMSNDSPIQIDPVFNSTELMHQYLYGFDAILYYGWTVLLIDESKFQTSRKYEMKIIERTLNLIKQHRNKSHATYAHFPPTKFYSNKHRQDLHDFDQLRRIYQDIVDVYDNLYHANLLRPMIFVPVIADMKTLLHQFGFMLCYPPVARINPGTYIFHDLATKNKKIAIEKSSKLRALYQEADHIIIRLNNKNAIVNKNVFVM